MPVVGLRANIGMEMQTRGLSGTWQARLSIKGKFRACCTGMGIRHYPFLEPSLPVARFNSRTYHEPSDLDCLSRLQITSSFSHLAHSLQLAPPWQSPLEPIGPWQCSQLVECSSEIAQKMCDPYLRLLQDSPYLLSHTFSSSTSRTVSHLDLFCFQKG